MNKLQNLVTQTQNGDLNAYNTIVKQFQDMAVGYAYSLLGDFHLAQDAAQDAFVSAYLDLHKLQNPAAFPGWFRRIVFTRCDRIRRKKRGDIVSIDDTAPIASTDAHPDAFLDGIDLRDHVIPALEDLPEKERTVLTLFYINRFPQKDIAAFLDLSKTTVNNRLHAARKRLKTELQTMASQNLQTQRPSNNEIFANRVQTHITTLENMHKQLCPEIVSLFQDLTKQPSKATFNEITLTTYESFMLTMPNPGSLVHFALEPLEGRAMFDIDMPLVHQILKAADASYMPNAPDQRPPFTPEQRDMLKPAFTRMQQGMEQIWRLIPRIQVADMVLDTNPEWVLNPDPDGKFKDQKFNRAYYKAWIPEPDETVVQVTLNVTVGDTTSTVYLCYPPLLLKSALVFLDGKN